MFIKKTNYIIKPILNSKFIVTLQNMNQNLIKSEYQVRGTIFIRSNEIQAEMKKGKNYPFTKLTPLNIGNPQVLNQLPLTFPREVISTFYSKLSHNKEALHRAETYKSELNSIQGYTNFQGMSLIRHNISDFITKRDNITDISKDDIVLTNGAGGGIKYVFESIINSQNDGVMVPIPQYPLYSALINLLDCKLLGYFLDEENNWSLNIENLRQTYKVNYDQGIRPKILVLINPGNPTGNILSKENLKEIVKFCYDNKMVIIADEVYQNNIYKENKEFNSVRKIVANMEYPFKKTIVFSLNSVSKGYYGECGLRGGYLDMYNVPDVLKELILHLASLNTSPNVVGQLSMDLLVKPPSENDASKETVEFYNQEKEKNFQNLKLKAKVLYEKLNKIPGFKCNDIEGAMYAFPKIDIPSFRIDEANSKKMLPDLYYAYKLLENTGIITVPGSGFGQLPGTHHIRLTNLVNPIEEMEKTLDLLKEFTIKFFDSSFVLN